MQKISIFIPVYRESDLLDDILKSLLEDTYNNKEIITVVDEPTENSLGLVKRYKSHVKFILNRKRKGKVKALNEAVKHSNGEILLFLDADVKIPEGDKNFLGKIVKSMKNCDILEIKKRIIKNSLLSRLVSYDYIAFNFIEWAFCKKLKKCIGVNGAAFAIKREVFYEVGMFKKIVDEDLEIGAQAFFKNKKFKYAENIEVLNKAPNSWKHWFKQRKRWGVGFAVYLNKHYRDFAEYFLKCPQILAPLLPFLLPNLFLIFSTVFMPAGFTHISIPLSATSSGANRLLSLHFATIILSWNVSVYLGFFVIFFIVFFAAARKLKYEFSLPELFVYVFFYYPISMLVYTLCFVRVFVFSDYRVEDWKV
jgi:cellulose synthase/poly-beta-1,6-N-acetylglucosamine synthase-like glycosyltransferase